MVCKSYIGKDNLRFEQELCKDLITLMSSFSARIYGKRSAENRKKNKK